MEFETNKSGRKKGRNELCSNKKKKKKRERDLCKLVYAKKKSTWPPAKEQLARRRTDGRQAGSR